MRKNGVACRNQNWSHVLVVGELKKSDQNNKSFWLQIGSAVRNVFACQPTRMFVHAFTVTCTEMETWGFDRSGPYSGATFNIHEEPEKFVQVLCAYLMMSDEELGLDTFTKTKDSKLFVTMPVKTSGTKRKRLELDANPIAHQWAMVCRGTSCFLAKPTSAPEFDRVVKYSWISGMQAPEADLLIKASKHGVKGLAKVMGYQVEITSVSRLRDGLIFTTSHTFRGIDRSADPSFSQSQPPPSRSFSQFHGLSLASTGHRKRSSADWSSNPSKRSRSNSKPADLEQAGNGVTYPVLDPEGTSLNQPVQTPYDNRI